MRPVTVTLPESTLERLAVLDSDRSRAIVKATESAIPRDAERGQLPELVEVAPGVRVILVGPSRCLREIEWLRMIEIAPSRFLLILPSGTSIESLELALIDLMEKTGTEDVWETAVMQGLRKLLGSLRRNSELSKAELLLIQRKSA